MNVPPSSEEKSSRARGVRVFSKATRVISALFAIGALAAFVGILNDSGFENKKALFGCLNVFVGFGSYAIFHRSVEERG